MEPIEVPAAARPILYRARVVMTSIVTWLTMAAVLLGVLASALQEADLPFVGGAVETFVGWAAVIGGALAGAILVLRRLTAVLPDERGLLGPDGRPTETSTLAWRRTPRA